MASARDSLSLDRVLVLGMGRSGRAAARLVERMGGHALVTDDAGPGAAAAAGPESAVNDAGPEPAAADWIEPERAASVAATAPLLVPSPGVSAAHPVVRSALDAGVPVAAEPELAAAFIERPLLAVTGTNGKSTTVTLLARMLEAAGKRVFSGGNLGPPLSEAVGQEVDYLAVEISSFQLEWCRRLRPRVAALLNLSADHLDRHGDLGAYIEAKTRIFAAMGSGCHAVVGRDCPRAWRAAASVPGQGVSLTSFGSSPLPPGETGMEVRARERLLQAGERWTARLGDGWPHAPHDLANVAAAAEIVRTLGIGPAAVEAAVAGFVPLEHRLQPVGEVAGVRFFDDSKATNPAACVASLEAFDAPVILLAGGEGKGADFSPLRLAAARIKTAVVFGEAREALAGGLGQSVSLRVASSMRDAFETALEQASPGDVVLLAPACASFDEFSGFAERGRRFAQLVTAARGAAA